MRHRRRSSMRSVTTSFKKVLNEGGTGRAASTTIPLTIVTGTDSVAAGQTSATDSAVPTGAKIGFIEIQYACTNLVLTSMFLNWTLEILRSGQTSISPAAVGGNPQRNQIFKQGLFTVGQNQNSTHVIRWKIPPKFQRVREGDLWRFVRVSNVVFTDALQVIYKFYR